MTDWCATEFDTEVARSIAEALGIDPRIGALMVQRGIDDVAAARTFLEPSLAALGDPEDIADMERAVDRIHEAVALSQRVCVYGDYDVDGISSTALLVQLFRHLGLEAETYVPDRLREGYGLNVAAIDRLAERAIELIITVDGGANDVEALRRAREHGIDVVVTDHHPMHVDVQDEFPEIPVVHPLKGCRPGAETLCGVGVAFNLVWSLGRALAEDLHVDDAYREFMLSSLAYVALGTVADVVPLTGDNRVLVHYGLRAFSRTRHPGLLALAERGRADPKQLKSDEIAFRLAPLINAVGRLGDAGSALDLLISESPERASELAGRLEAANRERREIERGMVEASCERVDAELASGALAPGAPIVVADEGWHSGVAGIVAARLVDRYRVPTFVIAVSDGVGRGSGRTVPHRPLTPAYEPARAVCRAIGGHDLAGGITIDPDRIDDLRAIMAETLPPTVRSVPRSYDLDLSLSDVQPDFVRQLGRLGPHGEGNRVPRFRFSGLRIDGDVRTMGRDGSHLNFRVTQGGRSLRAVWFGGADHARALVDRRESIDLVAEIQLNTYQGSTRPELRVIGRA